MIHSGAIVAAGISQGLSTSLGIDLKVWYLAYKWDNNDRKKEVKMYKIHDNKSLLYIWAPD